MDLALSQPAGSKMVGLYLHTDFALVYLAAVIVNRLQMTKPGVLVYVKANKIIMMVIVDCSVLNEIACAYFGQPS